jgi:hypothetical protein
MLGTPRTIQPVTATGRKLVEAGFSIIREVASESGRKGRWYEVITPDGHVAVFLKQGERCFHVFGETSWTTSGSSIETAHLGGLGDAISTDAQMKTYERLVANAPPLAVRYDALWIAKGRATVPCAGL